MVNIFNTFLDDSVYYDIFIIDRSNYLKTNEFYTFDKIETDEDTVTIITKCVKDKKDCSTVLDLLKKLTLDELRELKLKNLYLKIDNNIYDKLDISFDTWRDRICIYFDSNS